MTLTVTTLLKMRPSPNGAQHGERPFWAEWGPAYLRAWLACVARHVPQPHRVVVMTDSTEIVRRCGAVPVLLDVGIDAPGFWAKLNMFRDVVSTGKTLYCDLDNVIVGSLDELCALEPDPLIMLDDRRVPGLPNGSLILFDAERCRGIWNRYRRTPGALENHYIARGNDYSRAYDQAFIADLAPRPVELFQQLLPEGYILNARSELPDAPDWQSARLIFGGGAEGKPHLSDHPGFALR